MCRGNQDPRPPNQGYISNAGFELTAEGIVVIDALGTPAPGPRALLAAIRSISAAPIRRVIVTHYHSDHFYGGFRHSRGRRRRNLGAPARATISRRQWRRRRLSQRRGVLATWLDQDTPLLPLGSLAGRQQLPFVLTADCTSIGFTPDRRTRRRYGRVLVREDQALFTGDLVFSGRVPFVGDADSRRWLAAMDELPPQSQSHCAGTRRGLTRCRRGSCSRATTCAICARPWAKPPRT